MKIRCLNGYFIFEETGLGQASDFMAMTGLELVEVGNYFTFKSLTPADDFSIGGVEYLGFEAKKTFEGEPWEVFKANDCVYDFTVDKVVDKSSISVIVPLQKAGSYFVSSGLIKPGSITEDGNKILSYTCWYNRQRSSWLYSGVEYDV